MDGFVYVQSFAKDFLQMLRRKSYRLYLWDAVAELKVEQVLCMH